MLLALCATLMLFQDPPEIKENLEVSLRQIQVRVQDRMSIPMKGLTLEDFRFKRNGKQMVPESFIEIDYYPNETIDSDDPTPVIQEEEEPLEGFEGEDDYSYDMFGEDPRAIAILLDPGITTVKGFANMKEAAKKLVAGLPEGTQVTVYQLHFNLRNLVPLSRNRRLINERIDDAVYFSDLWNKISPLQTTINSHVADLEIGASGQGNTQEDNPESVPGTGRPIAKMNALAELLKFKRQVKDMHVSKVANSLDAIGQTLTNFSGERAIYFFTGGGYMDDQNIGVLKGTTARLNWENIPINAIHFRDRETRDLNQLRMARMTEETLRKYNLWLMQGGFMEGSSATNSLNEDENQLKSAPEIYAGETGGTFVSAFNPLQIDKKLKALRLSAGHYYLVSYKTDTSLDTVKVELTREIKGARIYYGDDRGNYIKRLNDQTRREKNLDFASSLLYGFEHRDTEADWEFEWFQKEDGTHVFPVLGRLYEDFADGGYEVGMIALDQTGQIMDERKFQVRTPGKEKGLLFYDLLVTQEKPMSVRAIIQERTSGKSTLAEFYPEGQQDATALSSLIMIPKEKSELHAIHVLNREKVKLGKKKIPREKLDPLFKGRSKQIPFTTGAFPMGEPIGIYFHAQFLDGSITNYDLESFIQMDKHRKPAPIQLGKVEVISDTQVSMQAYMDTSKLDAGQYTIGLRLRDKRTGKNTRYSEQIIELN